MNAIRTDTSAALPRGCLLLFGDRDKDGHDTLFLALHELETFELIPMINTLNEQRPHSCGKSQQSQEDPLPGISE
ncbi:MAG: hypothetical protein ACKVT0_01110, partial [Planctomycetaceae bacterium]